MQTDVLLNGSDVPDETFNTIECTTDYQTTGVLGLVSNITIYRKFRTWYAKLGRSNTTSAYVSAGFNSKLKDKTMKVKLTYNNSLDKTFIVRWINVVYNILQSNNTPR